MRIITEKEVTELPKRLISFIKRLTQSTEISDEYYSEMWEIYQIYFYRHNLTDDMFAGRAIDFTENFERIFKIMSGLKNFDNEEWKKVKSDPTWDYDNVEIEESLQTVGALPYFGNYVSCLFDPPNCEAIKHEVYPSDR